MKQGELTKIVNEHYLDESYLREDRLNSVSYPKGFTEKEEALVKDVCHNYDCTFGACGSSLFKGWKQMSFYVDVRDKSGLVNSAELIFKDIFEKYGFEVGRVREFNDSYTKHLITVIYKNDLNESLLRENTSNIKQLYKKSPCKATIMSNLKDDIWDRDDFVRKVCNALGKNNDLLKKIKNFMPDLTNNPNHFIKLFLKFSDENTCESLVKKLGWSSYVKNLPSDLGFNESYLKESRFGSFNYTYGVHAHPNGEDIILAGSKTLDNAVDLGIEQVCNIYDSPFMSNQEKFDYINTMYLSNDDTGEIDVSLEFDEYVDNVLSELLSRGIKVNESYLREDYTDNKLIDEFIKECLLLFNELGIKRGETTDTELFVPVEQDSKQLWDNIHEQASNNGFGIRTMEKDLGDDENYYYLYITKTKDDNLDESYLRENYDYIMNDVFESVGDDRAIVNEIESYFPKDRVEKFYHFIANEDNYPNPIQFNTAKDFEEFRSSSNRYYNTDKIYESIVDDFINLFKDEEVNGFIKYLIDKYNIDLNPYSYLD